MMRVSAMRTHGGPVAQPLPHPRGCFGGVRDLLDFHRAKITSTRIIDANPSFAPDERKPMNAARRPVSAGRLSVPRGARPPPTSWTHLPEISKRRRIPAADRDAGLSGHRQQRLPVFADHPQQQPLTAAVRWTSRNAPCTCRTRRNSRPRAVRLWQRRFRLAARPRDRLIIRKNAAATGQEGQAHRRAANWAAVLISRRPQCDPTRFAQLGRYLRGSIIRQTVACKLMSDAAAYRPLAHITTWQYRHLWAVASAAWNGAQGPRRMAHVTRERVRLWPAGLA